MPEAEDVAVTDGESDAVGEADVVPVGLALPVAVDENEAAPLREAADESVAGAERDACADVVGEADAETVADDDGVAVGE